MRIKSRRHKHPDLVENPRAAQDKAEQKRGLEIDHEAFLNVERLDFEWFIIIDVVIRQVSLGRGAIAAFLWSKCAFQKRTMKLDELFRGKLFVFICGFLQLGG